MCGRFVISSNDTFGLKYETSYNIVPSQMIPVKIKDEAKLMKWSYAPLWKKDMNLINCRSETMHEKASFKSAKRCVIFHNGWFEWQRKDKEKIPFYHYSTSNNFAGLYNEIGCLILTRNSTDYYLEGEDIINSHANNNINFHRISKDVNNPRNNNSSLIEAVNFS